MLCYVCMYISLGQVHKSWERDRSYPIHISQMDPIGMFAK